MADAAGADVAEAPAGVSWALVVGNEGAGPRPEVIHAATLTVRVPMTGAVESLNAGVAGSILLYEMSKEDRRA